MAAAIQAGMLLETHSAIALPLDLASIPSLCVTPPHPALEFSVVIPARDEETTIDAALAAFTRQVDLTGYPLDPRRFEIIVLANNCRDTTAAVARAFAARHPWLRLHVVERFLPDADAHVGTARRLLMDEAYRRLLRVGRSRGVIASTDADSNVESRWIAATLDAVARGADAVGGRILVDPGELATLEPSARTWHLRDVGYRSLVAELEARLDPDPADPWPRHFQHFGPSLAVTAACYGRIGGIPVRRWLEDVALYSALVRIDARIRHDPRVRLTTSARANGRTDFGFAGQLNAWTGMARDQVPFLVESLEASEARIRLRRELRRGWADVRSGRVVSSQRLVHLAVELGVGPGWLSETIAGAQPFGALYEQVLRQQLVGDWGDRWPLVAIEVAIPALRARLATLRRAVPVAHAFEQVESVASLAAAD